MGGRIYACKKRYPYAMQKSPKGTLEQPNNAVVVVMKSVKRKGDRNKEAQKKKGTPKNLAFIEGK